MNEQEAQEMLERWKKTLEYIKQGNPFALTREECEEVIILIRSYLMTFEREYPFD